MNDTIGFIGMGTMGCPMAKCLLSNGFSLIVYDISPEKVQNVVAAGAKMAATARELAARADVIISMLPKPEDTEALVLEADGIIHTMKAGKVFIDMSTSSPALTLRIHEAMQAKSVQMLDAPVSGGFHGAQEGSLTIMVGGEEETYKKCEPIFRAMGETIHYTGKAGNGHLFKLLNNLLYSINMCASAEVLAMGEQLGLDISHMTEVFNSASGSSYCLSQKVPKFILTNDYSGGLKTNLLLKDIELAMNVGKNSKAMHIFGGLAHQFFKAAREIGLGEEDNSAVIKLFRTIAEKNNPRSNRKTVNQDL